MSAQTAVRGRTGAATKTTDKTTAKRGRPARKAAAKRGRPARKTVAKAATKGKRIQRGRPRGGQSIWQQIGEHFSWLTDGAFATMRALVENGEQGREGLAGKLNSSPDAAGKQLSELRRCGVLSERIEGRNRFYSLTAEGRRIYNQADCIQQNWSQTDAPAERDSSMTPQV